MALGELEQVVLFALVRLGGEAHSAAIIGEGLRRRVGRGRQRRHVGDIEAAGEAVVSQHLPAPVHQQGGPHPGLPDERLHGLLERGRHPLEILFSHAFSSPAARPASTLTIPSCADGSASATISRAPAPATRRCPPLDSSWTDRTRPKPEAVEASWVRR